MRQQSVQVARCLLETQRLFKAPEDCMDAEEEFARHEGRVLASFDLHWTFGWNSDVVTFVFREGYNSKIIL
ncbi:hypothetical protein LCGC14_1664280 [marine sediment metagenome]|uniref:Uncharacterized protein n=1 Tax=marine sediment metagenome TaxID=412755 RepID=A0A0F9HT70_9ZZZZ